MNKIKITSLTNDLIKYVVKLQNSSFRKKEGMILLDGEKSILSTLGNNFEIEYLFLKNEEDFKPFFNLNIKNLIYVDDKILKKISTTKSPTFVVGVVKEPKIKKEDFLKLKKIALIEDIKDAGNLGTIIRSANAFSMDGIILFGNCVDLYNTKTIRSSASNIFKIPIIQIDDIDFIHKLKKTHQLIATTVNTKNNPMNFTPNENFIIAFGCEACGLSKKIIDISDENLTIPMANDVESLNLGVCASIIFAFFSLK